MNRIPLRRSRLAEIAQLRVDGRPVEVPAYPAPQGPRICHIGVGAFHRSHQAWALHRLLQAGRGEGWQIVGIGLRPADRALHAALCEQDGLYSLWTYDGERSTVAIVGAIGEHIDASLDPAAALAALADPATAVISLTVTEAGYCLGADCEPDPTHPDLLHDVAQPQRPRSAPGLIVEALRRRRDAGIGGVTALSCDNLIGNGHRLRRAVLGLARRQSLGLADWIEAQVSFPGSMVDRITPATTPARRELLCAQAGFEDAAPVICEDWFQWVIEDRFVAGRPALEHAGATFSSAVERFEAMKVGMLNGGHSALAHAALLQGYEMVHDAMGDPILRGWVGAYMGEVATTLDVPDGVDVHAYHASLLRRFANPAIEDRVQRLAQDTCEKFRQALLPPLVQRLRRGVPVECLATAVALWLRYLRHLRNDAAARAAYQDSDRDRLMAAAGGDVDAFLAQALPVPGDIALALRDSVERQLRALDAGLAAHLEQLGRAGPSG